MNFFYKNKINRKKITIRKGIRQECTILPMYLHTFNRLQIYRKKTYLEMDKKYRYVARFDDDIAILSEEKEF